MSMQWRGKGLPRDVIQEHGCVMLRVKGRVSSAGISKLAAQPRHELDSQIYIQLLHVLGDACSWAWRNLAWMEAAAFHCHILQGGTSDEWQSASGEEKRSLVPADHVAFLQGIDTSGYALSLASPGPRLLQT